MPRFSLVLALLAALLTALRPLPLWRRWRARLLMAQLVPTRVTDRQGVSREGRKVLVQSVLPADPAAVWAAVQRPATLRHIAWPLLRLERRDGGALPSQWRPGPPLPLALWGLQVLPLGHHTIQVAALNEGARALCTQESGQLWPVWTHQLAVRPLGSQTLYRDEVRLYGGRFTPLLGWVALGFYCWRHLRWQQLAARL